MALSENAKRVAALRQEGKDPATIAKELRMSIADVHEHRTAVFAEMDTRAREEKLRNPDGRKRGRRHKRTTDDELLDLAEMLGAGIKQAAIAYKMGRSVPWVSKHKAQALELMWRQVKLNHGKQADEFAARVGYAAEKLAREACQLAATARKAVARP